MGAWSLYFLLKLALYARGSIGLHVAANLAFAAALAWPLGAAAARRTRAVLAVPVAFVLFYWDSYLPAWSRTLDQAGALSQFRLGYLLELAQRFVSLAGLLTAAAALALYLLLAQRVRFATWVFAGLVAAAVLPAPRGPLAAAPAADLYTRVGETPPPAAPAGGGPRTPGQLDETLDADLGREHGKTIDFARAGLPRFDLVLLSVCSLSRDDLAFEHAQDDPWLARFDIVLRHFNSAATYSGPAVLRLLHGTCGQTAQRELYGDTAPDACYLFRNLRAAGYAPALLLNHDGRFDRFAEQLRQHGGVDAEPLDNRAAAVTLTAFDGSPVRSDYEVLAQWQRAHLHDQTHPALLYNTISLHDGTRGPGLSSNSLESYGPRLRRLFGDFGRFFDLIEASGRPTVVVLLPEHGAALRGDAVQVAGLRELPTPAITSVPVAVKLFGFPGFEHGAAPLVLEQDASYLTLNTLLAALVQAGPAATSRESLRRLLPVLPAVPWIAENENTVLLRAGQEAYLRSPAGQWTPYDLPGQGLAAAGR